MKADLKLQLLQDGTYADPKDLTKDKDGVLRNKNGVGLALSEDGKPLTLGDVADLNAEAAKVTTDATAPVLTQKPAKAD